MIMNVSACMRNDGRAKKTLFVKYGEAQNYAFNPTIKRLEGDLLVYCIAEWIIKGM